MNIFISHKGRIFYIRSFYLAENLISYSTTPTHTNDKHKKHKHHRTHVNKYLNKGKLGKLRLKFKHRQCTGLLDRSDKKKKKMNEQIRLKQYNSKQVRTRS